MYNLYNKFPSHVVSHDWRISMIHENVLKVCQRHCIEKSGCMPPVWQIRQDKIYFIDPRLRKFCVTVASIQYSAIEK